MTRRAVSHRSVFVVFFGLVLAALAAGGLLYFGKLRYVPKAARHAPVDAGVTARLSVERVGLFAPARTHLMPLVDSVAAPDGMALRRQRLEKQTKLEFNVDLREVVVALGPAPEDWVVVFGGMFPRADWVGSVAKLLKQEGREGRVEAGVWSDPAGFFLSQAPDGCVVLASSRERLDRALTVRPARPPRGDLEITLSPGGLKLLRQGGLAASPATDFAQASAAAVGTGVDAEITLAPAMAADSATMTALSADLKRLGAGKIEQKSGVLKANFDRDGLDRAAAHLAGWLKLRLGVASVDPSRAKGP